MFDPRSIHIGRQIEEQIKAIGMTKAEFGRRINTSRQNVNTILRKETLDASLLYEISTVLQFNFFSYYAEKLPSGLGLGSGSGGTSVQSKCKRTFSLTITPDSEITIEELLRKLSNWSSGKGRDDDKGEEGSVLVPA